MLGGIAHQAVDGLDRAGKIFMDRDSVKPLCIACRFAILVKDINQINVAGDVQLTGAQLAHANDPKLRALTRSCQGLAMPCIQG